MSKIRARYIATAFTLGALATLLYTVGAPVYAS